MKNRLAAIALLSVVSLTGCTSSQYVADTEGVGVMMTASDVRNVFGKQDVEDGRIIAASGIQAESRNSKLVLTMTEFVVDDYIDPMFHLDLDRSMASIAGLINRHPDSIVTVAGHTASDGTPEYNLFMSRVRARAVAEYLQKKGVPAERIEVQAYGEVMPKCSNETLVGRNCNRRVEVILAS